MKKFIMVWLISAPAMASFSGYNFERLITISSAGISNQAGVLNNFPFVISTMTVTFSTSTSGGRLLNPNGYDMAYFTDPSCASQFEMNWDTETYNDTGSTLTVTWVKIPTLTTATLTAATFYVCYGDAGITTYQGYSTATWDSNFLAVYHFRTGSTFFNDSTINGANMTNVGLSTTTGKFGYGITNGSGLVGASMTTGNYEQNGKWTFSTWFNNNQTAGNESIITNNVGEEILLDVTPAMEINFNATQLITSYSNDNNFHLIEGVYDGTRTLYYLDGLLAASRTTNIFGPTTTFTVGSRNGGTFAMIGLEDELRISAIDRSPDWILTEFNNQLSPFTSATIGPEIQAPVSSNRGLIIEGGKVRINGGKVSVR